MVTLINATRPAEWKQTNNPYDCAEWIGLNPRAADSTSWDIFDAVLEPGYLILLVSWKDAAAAQAYEDASAPNDKARVRRVRIVRDYGKYDRREAPQYYADAKGGKPLHPDTAPSGTAGLLRVRPCVRPGASREGAKVNLARRQRRHTIKETRRNDERGAEASPKFRVLLTASLVSSLIVFDSSIAAVSRPWIRRSLEASFAIVRWVISAYVLILIGERETAPFRAEAPAMMPCKLIDCRAPL
jgi:hypothetical protein